MRLLPLLLLVWLAGCATYAAGPPLPDNSTLGVGGGEGAAIGSRADAYVEPTRFTAPPDSVWTALVVSYGALGLTPEVVDRATWTVGSPRVTFRGRFLDRPGSTFLTCGGTAGVAEVADQHVVALSIFATLSPVAGGGTELRTRVGGSANDPFTSVPPRPCVTTGTLERSLDAMMRAGLRGEGPPSRPAPAIPLLAPADPPAGRAAPALPSPTATRRAFEPKHALLLAAGGVAGGAAGTLLGSMLGGDCEKRCLNARGMLGPLVGNAVLVPVGVHITNARRGSLVQSFLVSAGWAALGAVVSGLADERWGILAVAPGQILTSILIERSTTAPPPEDRR